MRHAARFVLAFTLLAFLAAGWIAPWPYDRQFREEPSAAPSRLHLLGTDAVGRDRFSRLLYGGRISIVLAPAAALVSLSLALALALAAALAGVWWERAATAVIDLFLSLPWLFLLLTVRAMLPLNTAPAVSVAVIFALLGLLGWAAPARVFLAAIHRQLASDYVLLARASGTGPFRLALSHLLPNLAPVTAAQLWTTAPAFLLSEANLSVLGLGVSDPLPSWGNLIRELRNISAARPSMGRRAARAAGDPAGLLQLASLADEYGMRLKSLILVWLWVTVPAAAQSGGELRFCLHSEPRTLHPALADDEASDTLRYLMGGVLVRINRGTQQTEPGLAKSWKVLEQGRAIRFELREGVVFSDGTRFTADDVVFTMETLTDPALHSSLGDSFRTEAGIARAAAEGPYTVVIRAPAPLAGGVQLFDEVVILSRRSPLKEAAVLGPFRLAERKTGAYIRLERNPHYWKIEHGRRLPYLDAIRLEIQQNRELELLRFRRGEVHLITSLDPDSTRIWLARQPGSRATPGRRSKAKCCGSTWPLGATSRRTVKQWFASRNFRLAVSDAIRRDDLCRVVYHGHASPGSGPFPRPTCSGRTAALQPHAFDLALARRLLDGRWLPPGGNVLRDRDGHPVEFSLVTNAGNRAREQMASMIQQDLAAIGIRLNVVTLDFPSLIERIAKSTATRPACWPSPTSISTPRAR